tara:strand:- start:2508 stop:3221 length:714 start_codon:yes stop_codon:yes gene_type:complete
MNRYVIIPTRESMTDCEDKTTTVGKLNAFLTDAGWKVHFVRNAKSMLGAFREGVEQLCVLAKDYVIFCHDDIEILNNIECFNKIIDIQLEDPTTGFTGVAGSAIVTDLINWFACAKQYKSGGGMIYHGDSYETMGISPFGHEINVVTLDGVFLATTGKILHSISLRSPSSWKSKWHHYDTFLTLQCHIKNKVNRVAPLCLRHASGGDYNDAYRDDIPRVATTFAKHLPAQVKVTVNR